MKFSLLKCPKYLIGICVSFWFLIYSVNTFAQTPALTYNIVQLPCNSDGVIELHVENMTPPLSVYCWGNQTQNFNGIESLDFTLSDLGLFNEIYIIDALNNTTGEFVDFYSFTIDYPEIIEPICPEINTVVELTINNGETPGHVDFYNLEGDLIVSGTSVTLPCGQYITVFYDTNECVDGFRNYYGDTIDINQQSPISIDVTSTAASCTNGSISITSVTGAVEPYTILWPNGSVGNEITNLIAGTYIITVTDNVGCVGKKWVNISQIPTINITTTETSPTCFNLNGSVTAFGAGGMSPYTYLWPDGQTSQTINNIGRGEYYVTVTDANGCTNYKFGYLNSSSPVYVAVESQNANCGANGSAILTPTGGQVPYSVTWSVTPQPEGFSAQNLEPGRYNFTVTDSNDCIRTGSTYIYDDAFESVELEVTNATCPNDNGYINAVAVSTNSPVSYEWSTSSTDQQINNLSPGVYTCTITNSIGCSIVKNAIVNSSSSLNIGINSQNSSCPFVADGSISTVVTGGSPSYNYLWSNGQIGNSITDLLPGYYSLTVNDSNGCNKSKTVWLGYGQENPECFCIVQGTAFEDVNNNCIFEDGETPLSNIRINCSGFGSVFTDSEGKYSFMLPDGDYTISETILGYYPLVACQNPSYNINVDAGSGCEMTYNFAHNVSQIHDIQTYINSVTCAVRGYNYIQKLIIKNAGTSPESNIVFGYGTDGQINYSSSTDLSLYQPEPFLFSNLFSYDGNIPTLLPGEVHEIVVHFNVPSNVPLNTELDFTDTCAFVAPMSNWMNDYSPWNNLTNYSTYVVGSFDPNNIEVYPKGTGTEGLITTNDSILTYTINFENTGTYSARNIYIYDTLNPNLDPNSLIPIASSHPCITRITEDGVVSFTFEDVYLPYYGIGKYGYVKYSVKQNDNLSAGTQIFNSANIVFDFNEPILTNTVVNTIDQNVDIDLNGVTKEYYIYPNPTQNYFTIKGGDFTSISVYNSLGQIMLNENDSDTINIEFLESGIYFVKIETTEGIVIKKLIKQ